jgi:molecular chaperone HscC
LGEFSVGDIPPAPAGEQGVDIRFTYDLNGVLEVEATVIDTGRKVNHLMTRYAKGLSQAEIARAVDEMQKLKTHPREETVNRFLLRRAERVFRELSLDGRDRLARLLDGFEAAMEMADEEAIGRHRAALERFLDEHDARFHDGDKERGDDDRYEP